MESNSCNPPSATIKNGRQSTLGKDNDSPDYNIANAIAAFDHLKSEKSSSRRIGRFELIEVIGHGGFAKVYRALDPALGREVALKIPKPRVFASPDFQTRFRREARTAAVLSHPAIVPLFETGKVGPITYIASEYCPGTDLANWFLDRDQKTDCRTR